MSSRLLWWLLNVDMMIVSKKGVNYNMNLNKNEIIPHWGRPSGLDGRQRCPGGNEQYERTITLILFHFDDCIYIPLFVQLPVSLWLWSWPPWPDRSGCSPRRSWQMRTTTGRGTTMPRITAPTLANTPSQASGYCARNSTVNKIVYSTQTTTPIIHICGQFI